MIELCDIYGEPCKICGDMVEMHLGDFETDRFEIFVICDKCLSKAPSMDWFRARLQHDYVVWDCNGSMYVVVSLTENAWRHRMYNHPNLERCCMVFESRNSNPLMEQLSGKDAEKIIEHWRKDGQLPSRLIYEQCS